ncbi:RAxF-45 family protein [Metabacillus herbersteinensis]|uniref:RAxF-45 family protein n=1 Tax=Metabacillus herbersteinensis TaxID=283816 RepID=A0ABV6GJP7_9BACI
MNHSVAARAKFLDYIYICRAIFHAIVTNGIRMPFFNNFIVTTEC